MRAEAQLEGMAPLLPHPQDCSWVGAHSLCFWQIFCFSFKFSRCTTARPGSLLNPCKRCIPITLANFLVFSCILGWFLGYIVILCCLVAPTCWYPGLSTRVANCPQGVCPLNGLGDIFRGKKEEVAQDNWRSDFGGTGPNKRSQGENRLLHLSFPMGKAL